MPENLGKSELPKTGEYLNTGTFKRGHNDVLAWLHVLYIYIYMHQCTPKTHKCALTVTLASWLHMVKLDVNCCHQNDT